MAGKKDRQRRLERERYERRMARRVAHDQRTRKWAISLSAALAVVVVAVGSFFLFRSTGGTASAKSAASASASASAPVTPTGSPSATPSAATVTEPAHRCAYTSSPPASRKVGTPPVRPDYKATYRATIHTNRGNIAINLLNSKATCTVNSFVYLASKKYFSSTSCHRLTTSGIFVLQCGDPTGTGSGGPGYKFADENLTGAKYTAGTVAMANSGPGTNGSQFFLVYKNSLSLPSNYTPFGTIVSGLNIIQKVAKAGSDNSNSPGDGHPKDKVEIESVTIKKT
ncbi:MAG TPA: peptidylprolyl isomerase [Streptosporangiaceae bacterium]|nr:peptidylprolyl isomerase [Streptosporangiaceae bacterium]